MVQRGYGGGGAPRWDPPQGGSGGQVAAPAQIRVGLQTVPYKEWPMIGDKERICPHCRRRSTEPFVGKTGLCKRCAEELLSIPAGGAVVPTPAGAGGCEVRLA